jgi:hypothetical protein
MGDPELRGDESILLRTQGVFVKSIPFEGILTNKRIILIDRTTNILPQKEIPLVTLKDFHADVNAIRDQIITLVIVTRTGETRQMILTFSRQMGGNRIKERDEWLRLLKENTQSSFAQVIRKVIPDAGLSSTKSSRSISPRIEIVSSPITQKIPPPEKTAGTKEIPTKKTIIKTSLAPSRSSPAVKTSEIDDSLPGFGTFCSQCGIRVTEESKFCNRCGSRIIVPDCGDIQTSKVVLPKKADIAPVSVTSQTFEKGILITGPLIEPSPTAAPFSSPMNVYQQEEIPGHQIPVGVSGKSVAFRSDSNLPRPDKKTGTSRSVVTGSHYSGPVPPSDTPPGSQNPRDMLNFISGKKAVLVIILIIISVAVILGAFFIFPHISENGEPTSAPLGILPTTDIPIITNSGTSIDTPNNLEPEETITYSSVPGNSPATVGL